MSLLLTLNASHRTRFLRNLRETDIPSEEAVDYRMEGLNTMSLVERLEGEDKEYWLHVEADSPLEKYPGEIEMLRIQTVPS